MRCLGSFKVKKNILLLLSASIGVERFYERSLKMNAKFNVVRCFSNCFGFNISAKNVDISKAIHGKMVRDLNVNASTLVIIIS